LIEKGTNADFGARPLRRALEQHVEDPLAEDILRGSFKGKDLIRVTVKTEADNSKHLFFEAVNSKDGGTKAQLAQAGSDAT
jgi:ATP-dependent Clp protease ATP-binding subunit ClpC